MDNQFERDMRFNTHIKSLAYHYIKLLNIKVAKTTIFEDLEVHPHFPTLFSLSDTFTRYNIPNYSYRCEASKLVGLTAPYFAYFSVENAINDFVLVTDVDEFTITYIYDRKPECLRKNDFYKRYKNIVWYAEPSENSGDMNYDTEVKKQNKLEYQKAILFGGVIFILLFLI